MKYSLIFLIPLISACSNQAEAKEKELLQKELELVKKELYLSKRENKINNEQNVVPEIESLVFNTRELSSRKSVTIDGKDYSLKFEKTYIEGEEPPSAKKTRILFSPDDIPSVNVDGDVYSISIKDVNLDGKQEVIASTLSNGTWAVIYTFTRNNDGKWKEAFDPFMWWTAAEGCPAQIYWTTGRNQIRVLTTNAASQNFECSDEITHKWD